MFTDMLHDDTLDINLDNKTLLIVYQTDFFHGKKNAIYISVYLRHRHQIRWCQLRGAVAFLQPEGRLRQVLHLAGQTTLSTLHDAHFFDVFRMQLPFLSTRNTTTSS